jgi:hypothetical protein
VTLAPLPAPQLPALSALPLSLSLPLQSRALFANSLHPPAFPRPTHYPHPNAEISAKDAAFIVAANFALCSAPDSHDIDWPKVPVYSNEKDGDYTHWCDKVPFGALFAQVAPPAADVQRYCSALLLPLLRASHSLGSDLIASKIENHFVKGEMPSIALLPSVISVLGPGLRLTAVDVAHVLVAHVLPLVKSAVGKLYVRPPPPTPSSSFTHSNAMLQVLRVLYGIMACQVHPPPSDTATECVIALPSLHYCNTFFNSLLSLLFCSTCGYPFPR